MINTLYTKLVLVLFFLFCIVGSVFLVAALYSAHLYQQEVSQRLNKDLAMYIAEEHVLIEDDKVRQDNLKDLFHKAMIINPSLELYLLDENGKVLSHSDALGDVQRKQVSLDPIVNMLAGTQDMPIMGDDPRNMNRKQVFTVAPIIKNGKKQGYIYAILGSERVEHITQLLQHSFIMKWSAGAIVIALVFSFAAGLVIFFLMTRKLHKLGQSMREFGNIRSKSMRGNEPVEGVDKNDIDRMALTFRDMAHQIQLQVSQLEETDSLRRELVANVSHDLRTPLASLKGYLETLLLKDKQLSDKDRETYLEIAHQHSERLSRLVNELFDLAKLEANELKPHLEEFSLAELLYDVSQKFHLRAVEKQINIDIDAEEDTPFVNADLGMIERVLDNLIDNSFQHTPRGGTIHLSLKSDKNRVDINVSDTGYGISADELPHIFKRFYRKASHGDTQNTDANIPRPEQVGAGLGLAIAHRIVELHGSELLVSSVLHKGTEFEFNLPTNSFA